MKIKPVLHWALLAMILVYIVTGLGITQFRTVEPLTLGILSKNVSFSIHELLLIPLVILLALHIIVSMRLINL